MFGSVLLVTLPIVVLLHGLGVRDLVGGLLGLDRRP
jgi:hypothetical protein